MRHLLYLFVPLVFSCSKPVGSLPPTATPGGAVPPPAGVDTAWPDALTLHAEEDRAAFVRWFTAIAESQYYRITDSWEPSQRDCAGLVRFAWREALRRHDQGWLHRFRYLNDFSAPDVAAWNYPNLPLVHDRLFRTSLPADESTAGLAFATYVDASHLIHCNTRFISRDLAELEVGDLLFFSSASGDHLMIAVRRHAQPLDTIVVYHDGGGEKGRVKRVHLRDLATLGGLHWRPFADNPSFVGIFRPALLGCNP